MKDLLSTLHFLLFDSFFLIFLNQQNDHYEGSRCRDVIFPGDFIFFRL